MVVLMQDERAQPNSEVPAIKCRGQLAAQRLAVRGHPAFEPVARVVGSDAQIVTLSFI